MPEAKLQITTINGGNIYLKIQLFANIFECKSRKLDYLSSGNCELFKKLASLIKQISYPV